MSRRRVLVLGSTGSIGTQALEVIAANRDRFELVGLTAGTHADALAAQAAETREQAVLASRDPLQDNAQALELEAELEQEIDTNARSSPAADDGGRDGSGPQARNSNR